MDPTSDNLPPGVHESSWEELVGRFGYTRQRLALLAGLKEALDALRDAGCRRVYIDGSFVTAKLVPNDFDACWESAGVDLMYLIALAPTLFEFAEARRSQREAYGGELFPAEAEADPAGRSFVEYFQFDRNTGEPKGIVAMNLGEMS